MHLRDSKSQRGETGAEIKGFQYTVNIYAALQYLLMVL